MFVTRVQLALIATVSMFAGTALGQVYLNGSVSQSTSHAGLLTHSQSSGTAGLDIALGSYVRVGLNHAQQFSVAKGKTQRDGTEDEDPNDASIYDDYTSRTHAWANSLDFTFVLYEGQIVMPYVKAGLVWKTYFIEEDQAGEKTKDGYRNQGPWPNLGAGIGFKLNKQFTLRLFYNTSPGIQVVPGEDKPKSILDRKTTLGLSYQI